MLQLAPLRGFAYQAFGSSLILLGGLSKSDLRAVNNVIAFDMGWLPCLSLHGACILSIPCQKEVEGRRMYKLAVDSQPFGVAVTPATGNARG